MDYAAEVLEQVAREQKIGDQASVREAFLQNPANFYPIGPLDLTTARTNPLHIPGPFKCIVLKDATDDNVVVNLILNTDADYAVRGAYPLSRNESVEFSKPIARAYLTWAAQAGKTATLYVSRDASVRSGKITTVQSGGVTINEGTGVTCATVALPATTATAIFAASSTRKKGTFRNKSGASIWVGPSSVNGASPYFEVLPGDVFEWRNSAALYGYVAAASSVDTMEES